MQPQEPVQDENQHLPEQPATITPPVAPEAPEPPQVPEAPSSFVSQQLVTSPEQTVTTDVPAPVVPSAPVAPPASVDFTSNPFLAFGKGLGAGLYKSPGAVLGLSALYFLVALLLLIGGGIVSGIISIAVPALGFLLMLVVFALVIAAMSHISGRAALVYQAAHNGNSMSVAESKEQLPVKYGFTIFAYYFLYGWGVFLGLLFFIVPGLIFMARWGLGLYVIADEKVGPIEALKRSWTLTRGNTWNMLGVITVQNLILGQSLLLAGTLSGSANRYFELKTLELQGIKNTVTHWANYVVIILVSLLVAGYFGLYAWASFSAYNNIQNIDIESSNNSTSESLNDSDSSSDYAMEYCFYDGDVSNPDVEWKCLQTQEECASNAYCKEFYDSLLNPITPDSL